MTAALAFAIMIALVVLGMPVVAAIAGSVVFYLLVTSAWPLSFPQQVVAGMNGFILLALPLFILAGSVMNAGGLSARIFDFARALVGPLRGGLGHVNVATSMFFGGLIGTSVADLAGTGSVVIPAMKRDGYPADFSAALTASSSGIGPLVPPSSPMILYAAVTGTSLGALFLAGVIPGLLLGLSQMLIVAYLARRRGWPRFARFSVGELWRTGRSATLAFGMPLIIVGGLVFGVFTPTESGAFAVGYALLVSVVIYRSIGFRDLYRIAVDATALTGEVMFIVGVSVALGWALSSERVPQALAGAIDAIVPGESMTARIIAMVLLAIVAGMILDPLIPIVVPIVLPTLLAFNIDLVHFGILMVLAVVIGQVTPPLAVALVVAGKIADVDLFEAFWTNMPFLLGMLGFTAAIVFFPEIVTWLPSLLRP